MSVVSPTRVMTIIAQDPTIQWPRDQILRAQATIPHEELGPGPRGYRVHVVDYDASQGVLYAPADIKCEQDPFADAPDAVLLSDPGFHAQNAYAIVMRLLARFEFALGRRVSWGFGGHQVYVAPHAFAEANAFYSEDGHGLFFGYFPSHKQGTVYTCLSHDIIAHEVTHALLDGLRDSYTFPSHPDQAGFHEGLADTVALLSTLGLAEVVRALLLIETGSTDDRVPPDALNASALRKSILLRMAEQFGEEVSGFRAKVLEQAAEPERDSTALENEAYEECHLRGEVLSAAVLRSFIEVWRARLENWLPGGCEPVPLDPVVEDAVDAADQLLTMVIRALDYCPVVDLSFGDFLSALLTADHEVLPEDGKYKYRRVLREEFQNWGIHPASGTPAYPARGRVPDTGAWERPEEEARLRYDCVHRESLQRDPDEVFRFLWENRRCLGVYEEAYTRVVSVRPCVRVGPDGFVLRETVSEYLQTLELEARQLGKLSVTKPKAMPDDTPVRLYGGGVLVFDEFGHLKYHVRSRLDNEKRQQARLDYLWRHRIKDEKGRYGASDGVAPGQRFAEMHLRRAGKLKKGGEWDD